MLLEPNVTCYGQVCHTCAMRYGVIVRNIDEILYTLREHQFLVLSNGRTVLVKLRKIICYKCEKNYFYVNILTNIEFQFLSVLSEKFLCPKCGGKK